jgi:cell division protein FtsI/penicillin-binding protein 2
MIPRVRYGRLLALGLAVLLAYGGLAGWLFYRQVVQHGRFAALARENMNFKRVHPARRGNILDRRGVVLATSVPVKTVCADPSLLAPYRGLVARTLAPLLELPEDVLLARLEPRLVSRTVNGSNQVTTSRYAVLKHKVPLDRWQAITQAMSQLNFGVNEKRLRSFERERLKGIRARGLFARDDYWRQYPNGSLAAQVLGFVASGESEKDEGTVFEDHGVMGVEEVFDDRLNGTHGWTTRYGHQPPKPGLDVVLTLDASIQYIVESELARAAEQCHPAGAVGLVLVPQTGEILALANWPAFDPARPGTNQAAFRNRAIMDQFEPGSTFKGVSVALALEHGVLSLEETVDCEHGYWREARLRDAHPYGVLSFLQVIAKSSNIGAAKGVRRLGPERLYQGLRDFGFGSPTLIPLRGEVAGVLHPPRAWDGLTITRLPIGQSISATPLQMAVAYATLANGGVRVPPRLVSHLADESGAVVAQYPVEPPRRVVREAVAAEITRALKAVVSPEGTGKRARLEHYTVAGKTGTAQVSAGAAGYKPGKYYSSFVGYLPADRPQICILVSFLEPSLRTGYEGGALAAPVFAAIAGRVAAYLRIEPDILPEEPGPLPEGPAGPWLSRTLAWQRGGAGSPPPRVKSTP